jgi:hypothetical protein
VEIVRKELAAVDISSVTAKAVAEAAEVVITEEVAITEAEVEIIVTTATTEAEVEIIVTTAITEAEVATKSRITVKVMVVPEAAVSKLTPKSKQKP